jgi:hypothetical protein
MAHCVQLSISSDRMRLLFHLILFINISSFGQIRVQQNAHAHNDYEHIQPLFDALSYGFNSVEADVHLVNGELYVSHDTPVIQYTRTLEQLYLQPIDSLILLNGGYVYKNYRHPFYLMIDIKTNGEETYHKLKTILNQYTSILHGDHSPLIIFISGNRPIETIVNDKSSLVALDGRSSDLGKGFSSNTMPVISIDFKSLSQWNGTGEIPAGDLNKISQLAEAVHNENKKLRLWAIPDQPNVWQSLLNAGVDLINTDRLKELSEFLNGN